MRPGPTEEAVTGVPNCAMNVAGPVTFHWNEESPPE